MEDQTRRDLIDYYKWVVNLASLVLTVTLAAAALGGDFYLECTYRIGAVLLGISIFLNWLLVKTLVTASIVQTEIENGRGGVLYNFFLHGAGWRMRTYGLIQNWSLLTGIALVIYSLVW